MAPHADERRLPARQRAELGFGAFNVVEGLIDHHLLSIHHVNETVPREQWLYWDLGFLLWGVLMWVGGWWLKRSGERLQRAHPH